MQVEGPAEGGTGAARGALGRCMRGDALRGVRVADVVVEARRTTGLALCIERQQPYPRCRRPRLPAPGRDRDSRPSPSSASHDRAPPNLRILPDVAARRAPARPSAAAESPPRPSRSIAATRTPDVPTSMPRTRSLALIESSHPWTSSREQHTSPFPARERKRTPSATARFQPRPGRATAGISRRPNRAALPRRRRRCSGVARRRGGRSRRRDSAPAPEWLRSRSRAARRRRLVPGSAAGWAAPRVPTASSRVSPSCNATAPGPRKMTWSG